MSDHTDVAELAFAFPLAFFVWGGVLCRRARRADPARAAGWTWLAAVAVLAIVVALIAVATAVTGIALVVALYSGALTSLAMLGGILAMGRSALPHLRLPALLDALTAATVVLAIAMWAIVIPGMRVGDPFLTLIFCVDLIGFAVAACLTVASASALERRIGRRLTAAGLACGVGDGLVAFDTAHGVAAPHWALSGAWLVGAVALCLAARTAIAGERQGQSDLAVPTLRWVIGRQLLPLGAIAALPFSALAVILVRGTPLAGWERLFFSILFLTVLVVAFARQAMLLLEHARAERRERDLREEVQVRHDERLEQSLRDPLTGSYNRRHLFDVLESEVQRARRYGTAVSLVLFDIDDFKAVNDSYGHAAGDAVLRAVSAVIEPLLRPSDAFARIGGEEFAVVLPETDQLEALLVADRLRTAVSRAGLLEERRITLSGGVGSCPGDAGTREELLRRTDAALYWAKRNGKDLCALTSDAITAALAGDGRRAADRAGHLHALVASIDGQSRYTRDHSENVAAYAAALGKALGFDRERAIVLRRAALLHDVGKAAVPVGILSKPGRLTTVERAEIERHAWIGASMLVRAGLEVEAEFVRRHHERWDGEGYPDRVAAEAIPLEARILFVCDSFEAMTSDRAYRPGMPVAEALAELERCAGTQFDPSVVEAFLGVVARGELELAALRA